MTTLLSRLKEAKTASRELDYALAEMAGYKVEIFRVPEDNPMFKSLRGGLEFMTLLSGEKVGIPPYTSSLDAAVALCEAVLPGYGVEHMMIWPGHPCQLSLVGTHKEPDGKYWHSGEDGRWQVEGATPALALCIAILAAAKDT